jgi:hypothetical protein
MSVSEIKLARPLTNGSGERVESNVVAIDRAGPYTAVAVNAAESGYSGGPHIGLLTS